MSFSQYSFGEPESSSQVERKRKYPIQCVQENTISENEDEERVTCMMCHSVLTSLTLEERSAHVNRCLDQKCTGIKKPMKMMRSPIRLKYSDENDIASIFSPNSSSLIAASSSSRFVKLKGNNDTKKKVINLTKLKTNNKSIVEIDKDDKAQSLLGTIQKPYEKNVLDLENFTDSSLTGITMPKNIKIASFSTQKSIDNMIMKESSMRLPSSVKVNANMEVNLSRNMTEDELALFNLRLQLGEYVLCSVCTAFPYHNTTMTCFLTEKITVIM